MSRAMKSQSNRRPLAENVGFLDIADFAVTTQVMARVNPFGTGSEKAYDIRLLFLADVLGEFGHQFGRTVLDQVAQRQDDQYEVLAIAN